MAVSGNPRPQISLFSRSFDGGRRRGPVVIVRDICYNLYMSLYRIHFTWKEKQALVKCRSLDLTHPYFVSMKDLVFTKESKLVINPAEDDIRREFEGTDHIMIPFQTVTLIEEFTDETLAKRADSGDTLEFPLS